MPLTPVPKNQSHKLAVALKQVKVIGFDLDDTLWPNHDVISAAVFEQNNYLQQQLSNLSIDDISRQLNAIVLELTVQDAVGYQDMTRLRLAALAQFCQTHRLPAAVAEEAFARFFQRRQQVNLFDHTIPLLSSLQSKGFILVAISNGNVDLEQVGIRHYFSGHWRAGCDGLAKPSGDMLTAACRQYAVESAQLLYVGDSEKYDVAAARDAGSWVALIADTSAGSADSQADFQFATLAAFYQATQEALAKH